MPMNLIIQEKRKSLGYTQEQIGDYLGVSTPAVNKWEKGTTCPDISLLPALARLLKVDMNTLFCFSKDLTAQEIARISNEVAEAVQQKGVEAGFAMANEKIQEYPNCSGLLYNVAIFLEGALVLAGIAIEEMGKYEEQLILWYERCRNGEDENIRNGAVAMLASKYLRQNEWEKAQEMLDLLPERTAMDRRVLQAELYLQQGKVSEAAELMERLLLMAVNEVQNALAKLTNMELAAGESQAAAQIAEKSRRAAEVFDMWEYSSLITPLQVALDEQNVSESIRLIKKLLASMVSPWKLQSSPLYYRIAKKSEGTVGKKMLRPLLNELENSAEYAFLRSNDEFRELIVNFRARDEAQEMKTPIGK